MRLKTTIMVAGIVLTVSVSFIISCVTVQRTVIPPPLIQGAEYIGTDTCALCHEEVARDFKYTDHGRIQIIGEPERVDGQGCEACHGAGSLHMEVGGGRGRYIINPGKNPEACFQCHL